MVFTIIFSILFLMCLIIIIAGISIGSSDGGGLVGFGIGALLVFGFVLALALYTGRSIYKQDLNKLYARKEAIELCLEISPSVYIIEEAQRFNKDIEVGNNYWERFNIEDRSEFKIDIDKHLKKVDNED